MARCAGATAAAAAVAWKFRSILIAMGAPIVLLAILPYKEQMGLNDKAGNCLYVLLLMACYWTTEVIDVAATALLPLVLFPLMGIMSSDAVAKQYIKDNSVLLIGSLLLAVAIEKSGIQKRIALNVLRIMGTGERSLVLGFMLSTWFISMWITNTAAAAMMITVAQCVLTQLKESASVLNEKNAAGEAPVAEGSAGSLDAKNAEAPTGSAIHPSNTAATLASFSEAAAEIPDEKQTHDRRSWKALGKALSLGVAYSASIGGIATLTGTGSNVVLAQNLQSLASEQPDLVINVTFATWMVIGVPVSIILLAFGWGWLQLLFFGFRWRRRNRAYTALLRKVIADECRGLGEIRFEELVVGLHLVVLVILWLTRDMGNVGGWGDLFDKKYATDGTAAITVAALLFFMPSKRPRLPCIAQHSQEQPCQPSESCLAWKDVQNKLPWGIVFLIGGGFALAEGVTGSGLSTVIGRLLATSLNGLPDWAMVAVMATVTAALTEVSSNVAIVTLFLPIVAKTAVSINKNPLYLMFPTCLAASFAFMLPVATPPNAIVFSTGVLKVSDMAKAGILMNVVGIAAATIATVTWGSDYFLLNEWSARNGSLVLRTNASSPAFVNITGSS